MTARKALGLLLLFAVTSGLVGCDLASKRLAQDQYSDGSRYQVIDGFLDLRYVENRDVAFRALRWIPADIRRSLVLTVGGMMIVALAAALALLRGATALERAALALILAGAVGNFVDRFHLGYVIDFINLGFWPTFNLADVYIDVGLIALLLWGRRLLAAWPRAERAG
jgi:signal peptidase II